MRNYKSTEMTGLGVKLLLP